MLPKFRFYHLTENEMYEVNGLRISQKTIECFPKDNRFTFITFEEDEGILMQSTELKDINGTEIFEGDILKVKYGDLLGETRDTLIIAKNPFEYSMEEAKFLDFSDIVEIIGNKFENRELLDYDSE